MSDKYISREAVIDDLTHTLFYDQRDKATAKKLIATLPPADVVPVDEIVEAVDEAIRVLNAINSRGNETFDYGDYCDLYDAISAIYPT